MVPSAPVRESSDDALQEYLDLLLKPDVATDTRPYAPAFAPPVPRPLRMPLPPLAPPSVESPPVAVAVAAPVEVAVKTQIVARPLDDALQLMAAAVVAKAPLVVETPPVIEPLPAAAPEIAMPVDSVESTQSAAALEPVPLADSLEPAPWADNGRPHWAQQRFEVLLFTVGGLNLAVPLVELGAIHALEDRELTPIFGQVDWFLGLLPLKEGALRVVDTAKVVMPERYNDSMPQRYRYVLTLSGSDWGLGVDTIHDSVQLEPEAVRWRSARGKRPWLAGTVVEQMCALLDASQLTWMFHSLDRHRGGRATTRL